MSDEDIIYQELMFDCKRVTVSSYREGKVGVFIYGVSKKELLEAIEREEDFIKSCEKDGTHYKGRTESEQT